MDVTESRQDTIVHLSKSLVTLTRLTFTDQLNLVAQTVKSPPAMWETRVQSLGCEDLLEKEMATHSSMLAWKIPGLEEPGGLQSIGLQSQTQLSDFTSLNQPLPSP